MYLKYRDKANKIDYSEKENEHYMSCDVMSLNVISIFEMTSQTKTNWPTRWLYCSILSNAVYYQYTKKLKKLNKIINQ